jgi:DeoR/GlpR family transcriptional regulator of sugar metabolism
MARSVVVLADSTKFDQVAPGFVFGFEEIDTIVTDSGIQADTLRALRARGVEVLVASEGAADPAPSLAAARA